MGNAALKTPTRPLAGPAPIFLRKRLQALALSGAALLLAIAAAVLLHATGSGQGLRIAATVNGVPIESEELAQAMSEQRAATAAYFKAKYDADAGAEFWKTSFGGEVPLEKLKRDALAQTVKLKLQQAMAEREGLTDDISYASFLKRLKAENERRASGDEAGAGVYGPKQYSEAAYYSLLNSDLIGALKAKLEGGMTWSDDELRAYYKAHAADQFTERTSVSADVVSVSFAPGSSLSETEAEAVMKAIAKKIDAGLSAADAAAGFEGQATVAAVQVDGDTARGAALRTPVLASKAQDLQAGRHTGVFKENGAYVLAVATNRAQGKVHLFAEVRDGIAAQLAEEAYDARVAEAVASATVDIDPSIYDRIKLDSQ
ncbi:peptidyl-prolyl cis-trans isomerase [Paenibacillus glycinis]|uniref:peptidylprolyl isomerase n=1 Tax=Paenibacillus glycinis TaxID=2697035 RepID=A0ABW9XQ24_9BACL|nr:peptidyl-prolyl cis-trans isomerase [Paenibacillus glycinis]NBD24521.1 hypothetical protein [Paenibacillus glycinis]